MEECAPLLGELAAPDAVPVEDGELLWEWLAPWRRERKRRRTGTMERYVLRKVAQPELRSGTSSDVGVIELKRAITIKPTAWRSRGSKICRASEDSNQRHAAETLDKHRWFRALLDLPFNGGCHLPLMSKQAG
eukprot:6476374-Amphidinium_carterae.1